MGVVPSRSIACIRMTSAIIPESAAKSICTGGGEATPIFSNQTSSTAVDKVPPIVVFCGPSGAGKSTLIGRLQREYPHTFQFSVSHTSRAPREGEVDGQHYHFVDRSAMLKAIAEGRFLEHAEYSGNLYGTSRDEVQRIGSGGDCVCLLDIDVQGVKQVKTSGYAGVRYVCVRPPSLHVLEQRLRARNTDSEQAVLRRLRVAAQELEYCCQPGNMDVVIENNVLDTAYRQLVEFLAPIISSLPQSSSKD